MKTNPSANPRYSRRDPNGPPIPWDKIRLLYITRQDRPTYYRLEQEFGLGRTTVQRRGKIEGWKTLREEHHKNIIADTQIKLGEKQTTDLAKAIEILDGLVEKLVVEFHRAKAHSLGSLSREIRETLKLLNVFFGQFPPRTKLNEEEMDKIADVLIKIHKKAPEEYEELKVIYEDASESAEAEARERKWGSPEVKNKVQKKRKGESN